MITFKVEILIFCHEFIQAKEKYRGVFEIQKSGDKTSTGEIGLDIRTHASPKVGQDQPTLLHTTLKNDVSFVGMRPLELPFLLIILIS